LHNSNGSSDEAFNVELRGQIEVKVRHVEERVKIRNAFDYHSIFIHDKVKKVT